MFALLIAAAVSLGPYVQDVKPDGFTVAFETATESDAEVRVDGHVVKTHGVHHEAHVDGLAPGRRYRYEVYVGGAPRVAAETATAPALGETAAFTFVVYGDTRDGGAVERALVEAMLAESPDLALHTGDFARSGVDANGWKNFFAAEGPLLRQVPLYPTLGNHEIWKDPAGSFFFRYFALPEGGREKRYYTFRYGASQFVVLDGNAVTREQTAWLEQTLAAAEKDARHTFVLLHQPPFSTGDHCGSAAMQRRWVELFERHHVRVVFGGHDHAYEHLERNGVKYFVSGGGGAPPYDERNDCASYDRAARRTYSTAHHFLRVRVAGDSVEVTAMQPGRPVIEAVNIPGPGVAPKHPSTAVAALAAAPMLPGQTPPAPPLVDDGAGPPHRWLYGGGVALALLVVVGGGMLRRKRVP